MARAFIALGTNLGDRPVNLAKALTLLGAFVSVGRRSPIYETAPMYVTDQPAFLNMVVEGRAVFYGRRLERLATQEQEAQENHHCLEAF